MTLEETARYLKTCENKGRITRNNGRPEEGMCEQFGYKRVIRNSTRRLIK